MFSSNFITGHKLEAELLYCVAPVALVGLNIGSRSSFRESPRHATPRHATPRHATPRHATPRHATPRHATPRHATPVLKS